MRVAIQWLGVVVVVLGTASACGTSNESGPMQPKEVLFITPSSSGGTAGGEPTAGGPDAGSSRGGSDAGSSSGGTAGVAGIAEGEWGAAGGHQCDEPLECPAFLALSHAIIKVDLPISVAEAADSIFTACRNGECYSAKGSAHDAWDDYWVPAANSASEGILLTFGGSEAAPFAVLEWKFADFGDPLPADGDHYSWTVQPAAAEAPTTLFDDRVHYGLEITDQFERDYRYCFHCYEIYAATVDTRAQH